MYVSVPSQEPVIQWLPFVAVPPVCFSFIILNIVEPLVFSFESVPICHSEALCSWKKWWSYTCCLWLNIRIYVFSSPGDRAMLAYTITLRPTLSVVCRRRKHFQNIHLWNYSAKCLQTFTFLEGILLINCNRSFCFTNKHGCHV